LAVQENGIKDGESKKYSEKENYPHFSSRSQESTSFRMTLYYRYLRIFMTILGKLSPDVSNKNIHENIDLSQHLKNSNTLPPNKASTDDQKIFIELSKNSRDIAKDNTSHRSDDKRASGIDTSNIEAKSLSNDGVDARSSTQSTRAGPIVANQNIIEEKSTNNQPSEKPDGINSNDLHLQSGKSKIGENDGKSVVISPGNSIYILFIAIYMI
jgi:hypothetical protein